MGVVTYPVSRRSQMEAVPRASAEQGEQVNATESVSTSRVRWQVTVKGSGPPIVLLHGTGSDRRSWDAVSSRLSRHATLIVPDLPGHGDSVVLNRSVMSLNGMARDAGELLEALDVRPLLLAGHSAGAALAVRMTLDRCVQPRQLVAVNGAFATFGGVLDRVFAPLAGLFSASTLVTGTLARKARNLDAVQRIIESTGSELDRDGLVRYSRLLQEPAHLEAMFAMMSNWDLRALRRDLNRLDVPLHLLVADRDRAVDPRQALDVESRCPRARITRLAQAGHLAHEEIPDRVAELILQELNESEGG